MCASYKIRAKRHEIQGIGVSVSEGVGEGDLDILVQGYKKTDQAPVMVFENGRRVLKNMYFSLCPRWSKAFPFKGTTYNARMNRPKTDKTGQLIRHWKTGQPLTEYIFEMPAWKASFRDRHCLVPMSYAIESSYFGTHAGNMVRFMRQDDALFFGVGIWDRWIHGETGDVIASFALLTDNPYEFFYRTGHDRSFFVIPENRWNTWLKGEFASPEGAYAFLRESRIGFDWKAEIDRPMKKGWDKRAPDDDEIKAIGETVWR